MNSGRAMPFESAAATDGAYAPAPLSRLTRDMTRLNDEAWREFHHRYFHRLYHYALKLHRGDHASAEDSVQSGFLRAVRNIKRFDDEDVFWSWLTLLVRCAAADQGRKASAKSRLLDGLAAHVSNKASVDDQNTNTTLVLLEETLSQLPEQDRNLLKDKYTLGLSTIELAEARDTSSKAIECRLRRLRRKLKSKIHALSKHIST